MKNSNNKQNEEKTRSEQVQDLLTKIKELYETVMASEIDTEFQFFLPIPFFGFFAEDEFVYIPIRIDLKGKDMEFHVPPFSKSGLETYPDHGVTKEGFVVSLAFAEAAELEVQQLIYPKEVKEIVRIS